MLQGISVAKLRNLIHNIMIITIKLIILSHTVKFYIVILYVYILSLRMFLIPWIGLLQ
jgi:hypothetical protein